MKGRRYTAAEERRNKARPMFKDMYVSRNAPASRYEEVITFMIYYQASDIHNE